jgi:molybdopterin converting factor small subunit
MSVSVSIHRTHRHLADGLETIEVEGTTIGECLQALTKRYSALRPVLFDNKGKLNGLLEIYLNMESAYPEELLKPVKDGDEIQITLLLSGG